MDNLLEIKNLKIGFPLKTGVVVWPVNSIDFTVKKGEILAIVGESGCGKSITAMSVLRLHSKNTRLSGNIYFNDDGIQKDILALNEKDLDNIRGNEISMVFQEPMTALNPLMTIGAQIIEPIMTHKNLSKKEAEAEARRLLSEVGITEPERFKAYPHQLSGGQRQRVMIAIAMSCNPKLLMADEPTTALDVTIQAQILYLLKRLQEKYDTALMLITHNLGVVAQFAQRVIVMYAGTIVEMGTTAEIFNSPSHPYTMLLLKSLPKIEIADQRKKKLANIDGTVPSPAELPKGCVFCTRCPYADEQCKSLKPEVHFVSETQSTLCNKWEGVRNYVM